MKMFLSYEIEKLLLESMENGTPFEYRGIKFIDIKFFYDFIESNSKSESVDFEEVIKDLLTDLDNPYELSRNFTKSGNPETIPFEYSYDYDEETGDTTNFVIEF